MKSKIKSDNIETLTDPTTQQPHMPYLQTIAFDIIKSSLGLLDKHFFALSRAAIINGDRDISPDLSELGYEDLRHLKSNFNHLADILRKIHDHVLADDPDLSKEVLMACSEAIIGRSNADSARRSLKTATGIPNPEALIAVARSSLLRIKLTVRKVGGQSTPGLDSVGLWLAGLDLPGCESATSPPDSSRTAAGLEEKDESNGFVAEIRDEASVFSLVSSLDLGKTGSSVYTVPTDNQRDMRQLESRPENAPASAISQSSANSSEHKVTLEERFAALRKATAEATSTNEKAMNATLIEQTASTTLVKNNEEVSDDASSPQKAPSEIEKTIANAENKSGPVLQPDTDTEEDGESTSHEKLESHEKVKSVFQRTITIDKPGGQYLKELSKSGYSKINTTTKTHDIIEFEVMGPDYRPVSQFTWFSKGPKNFVKKEELVKGLIRRHVAEKLNADPRSLGLFYKSKSMAKPRVQVRIMLDPYIRLNYGSQVFVLDFSRTYVHRSCLTVREVKAQARARIGEKRQHTIHLFLNSRPLKHDSLRLKDAGLLSDRVLEGWEPLVVQATVEIQVKDCVICGDELAFDKFPDRITSKCDHEANSCRKCMRKWIKTTLASKGFDKISCPECSAMLQHGEVKARAGKRTFEK
jgi:hypothetical protein